MLPTLNKILTTKANNKYITNMYRERNKQVDPNEADYRYIAVTIGFRYFRKTIFLNY